MRREFLNYFSTWEMVSICAFFFIAFAMLFYWVSHRYLRPYLINTSTHNTSGVFNILSITTILLAFTIVILWQFFSKASEAVAKETTSLEEIVMYSQALSKPAADGITEIIGNYLYYVVNKEWPDMRIGNLNAETNRAIKQLYYFLVQYSPSTENERLFYNKIIDQYENVLAARDVRADAINSVIPTYFFVILIVNLILLLMSVCLLDEKGQKAPLAIATLVASIAGINLGLTLSLDYPFAGEFSISSQPYTTDILGELYHKHLILNES